MAEHFTDWVLSLEERVKKMAATVVWLLATGGAALSAGLYWVILLLAAKRFEPWLFILLIFVGIFIVIAVLAQWAALQHFLGKRREECQAALRACTAFEAAHGATSPEVLAVRNAIAALDRGLARF